MADMILYIAALFKCYGLKSHANHMWLQLNLVFDQCTSVIIQ